MPGLEDWLTPKAAALDSHGLTRRLRPRPAGEALIDLAGNDYLGLSHHPKVKAAAAPPTAWPILRVKEKAA